MYKYLRLGSTWSTLKRVEFSETLSLSCSIMMFMMFLLLILMCVRAFKSPNTQRIWENPVSKSNVVAVTSVGNVEQEVPMNTRLDTKLYMARSRGGRGGRGGGGRGRKSGGGGARAPKKVKDDVIQVNGKVIEALPNAMFRVEIEPSNAIALVTVSGKIRKNFVRIVIGDSVVVELSAYDLTRGRITYRNKA